jgi:hypothetical protein
MPEQIADYVAELQRVLKEARDMIWHVPHRNFREYEAQDCYGCRLEEEIDQLLIDGSESGA